MAISFIGTVEIFGNPNSPVGDVWTFNIPGAARADDVILFVVGTTATVTTGCHVTTAGWSTTMLFRGDDLDVVIVAAYKMTGAETSPLTVTFSEDLNLNEAIPVALFYRGAQLPVAGSASSVIVANAAGGFDFTCPSQTPTAVGDWYIGIPHVNGSAIPIDSTPGNKRFAVAINDDGLAVFDLASTTTLAFGPQTCIANADAQVGSAHSFILPAAPGLVLAGGVADLALVLSADLSSGIADLSADGNDLAFDAGIHTAVLLSLFTDRRAEDDDKPPSGDDTDRRGWWGDQFAVVEGDRYGSRLWLLDREKITNELARRAEEYVREALAWMIEDRVAVSIDVEIETTTKDLLIRIMPNRPGKDPVFLRFAHVWKALAAGTTSAPVTAPMAGVSQDATSLIFRPSSLDQWATTLSVAGITSGTPSGLWLCQEASGNLADSIGPNPLVVTGAPTYDVANAGWSTLSVDITATTGQKFAIGTGVFNPAAESVAWFGYVALTATPGGTRTVLTLSSGATPIIVNHLTTNKLQIVCGSNTAITANTYMGAGFFFLGVVYNKTGSGCTLYTGLEAVSVTFATVVDGSKGLGAVTGSADSGARWNMLWAFRGAAAELSTAQVRAMATTLGLSPGF